MRGILSVPPLMDLNGTKNFGFSAAGQALAKFSAAQKEAHHS
jgi:hypothetical protein